MRSPASTKLLLSLFFVASAFATDAQGSNDISGLWYSSDSSRIYKIYATNGGYAATLFSSRHAGEQAGKSVLQDIVFVPKKNDFDGYIFATDGNVDTRARLTLLENGVLKIKLPRLVFFPVYMKWYRM